MNALVGLRESRFDPVYDSQAIFRRLLEATARPGTVVRIERLPLVIPPSRLRCACGLLLSLLDLEVTLHVLGSSAASLCEYLSFNTGARVSPLEEADFVFVTDADSGGRISRVRSGRLETPHEGATVVYAPQTIGALPHAQAVSLRMSGPGIPDACRLHVRGVSVGELYLLRGLMNFPLGVDIWFAAEDGSVAVIPRSTRWVVES